MDIAEVKQPGSNAVSIKNLTFRYKDQKEGNAIENINLDIENGQFVVIMGPSGAGKSTLANCLNGLIPNFVRGKYEGEVWVNGKKAKEQTVSKMAKDIGLVFQDFESQLFSTNTKLEIAFGPENFMVPRAEIHKRINRVLKIVSLEGYEESSPPPFREDRSSAWQSALCWLHSLRSSAWMNRRPIWTL